MCAAATCGNHFDQGFGRGFAGGLSSGKYAPQWQAILVDLLGNRGSINRPCEFVEAECEPPEVFELAEDALDEIALGIAGSLALNLALFWGRDIHAEAV